MADIAASVLAKLQNKAKESGRILREAIHKTLQNRGTSYDRDTFVGIEDLSSSDTMKTRWIAFLKKLKKPGPEFGEVLNTMRLFLKPIFAAVVEERGFWGHWECIKQKWIER